MTGHVASVAVDVVAVCAVLLCAAVGVSEFLHFNDKPSHPTSEERYAAQTFQHPTVRIINHPQRLDCDTPDWDALVDRWASQLDDEATP